MPKFVPGLDLNAAFYSEAVEPLIANVPHAAARLGWGSEVLGFDTERSTDHGWGPQLLVFVGPESVDATRRLIDDGLPATFRGWPVRYGWDDEPVRHHVSVATLGAWLLEQLGVDASDSLGSLDWLVMPQQKLLEVTAGAVYRDDTHELTKVRERLRWYPDDVWLWMIASQWRRIAQEEAFVGRAAEVGDELGSRVMAARLARELMRLWFLFARAYWPYTKWFGSAFTRLPESASLSQSLESALAADNYADREAALAAAYTVVADRHNEARITDVVDGSVRFFYGRPYRVLMADRFVDACLARVTNAQLKRLPLVGSVDQVADSTDLLTNSALARRTRSLYRD